MIIRLHHAQITIPVGAEETARTFYCDMLGLQEIPKPESLEGRGGFWLALGDVQIHVGVENGVDRRATKAHIAYQVENIEAWHALLLEHEIQVLESVPIPGYDRFEFRDPFGNRVEFIQPQEETFGE
jgi:catechol 2,3-dioxygenase-like lactoylglutathione lyase family enzyme